MSNENNNLNNKTFEPTPLKISTMTTITKIGKYPNSENESDITQLSDLNIDLNLFSRFANIYSENDPQTQEKDGGIIGLDYFSNFTRGVSKINCPNKFYNQATLIYHYWGFRTVNVKIFNNGKLQMTGIQNENEAKNMTKFIINNLKKTHIKIYSNYKYLPQTGHYNIVFNNKTGKINYYRFNYCDYFDNSVLKYEKIESLIKWVSDNSILEFINFLTTKKNGLQNLLTTENVEKEYNKDKIESDITYISKLLKRVEKIRKTDNDIIKSIKESYYEDLNEMCLDDNNDEYITFGIIDLNHKYKLSSIKIELINSDFNTNFELNNDKLHQLLLKKYKIFSSYEPDDYPGVKNKFYFDKNKEIQNGICDCEIPCVSLGKKSKCVQITISVFSSGNTIITGAKSIPQIVSAYNFIVKILKDNYNIVRGKQVIKKAEINNNDLRKMLRKKRLFYFKKDEIIV